MNIPMCSPLPNTLNQLLLFACSFLDDAVLLALPRLGLHVHGLQWISQWVSPVMLSGTLLYWAGRFLYNQYRTAAHNQTQSIV